MPALLPGLSATLELLVTEDLTASRWGSGLVPVYSTPALVGAMEAAAVAALEAHLEPGATSVGGRIDVRHLAATPVGMSVRVTARLEAVEGRKLRFSLEAWDALEKIGEAEHERVVVDRARFVAKVEAKGR
jgi:predicted thioesterase